MTAADCLSFAEWERKAVEQLQARRTEKDEAERARLASRAPREIEIDEWIAAQIAAAPPLSPSQCHQIAALFSSVGLNPQPASKPVAPRLTNRALDPATGSRYGRHLRASDGACGRCRTVGRREVDHCHEHDAVRGLICKSCNQLSEEQMGSDYRKNCPWCEWDLWLERELAL